MFKFSVELSTIFLNELKQFLNNLLNNKNLIRHDIDMWKTVDYFRYKKHSFYYFQLQNCYAVIQIFYLTRLFKYAIIHKFWFYF